PSPDHVVELGKNGVDLLFRLHALDDEWQIERELEKAIGAQMAARAVSHDRSIHGGAGVVLSAQHLDDRRVQRLSVELVALADVDAHQHALALEAMHGEPPRVMRATARPAARARR